jgi:hypothetical protein
MYDQLMFLTNEPKHLNEIRVAQQTLMEKIREKPYVHPSSQTGAQTEI